jgi:hypothetical protein
LVQPASLDGELRPNLDECSTWVGLEFIVGSSIATPAVADSVVTKGDTTKCRINRRGEEV